MKNKKLLLIVLLSVTVFGGTFAQFRYQSDTNIGQTSKATITTNKDTLIVHFNTAKANSFWLKSKKDPAKDSIVLYKCTTVRGIQCLTYTDATTTTAASYANDFKGALFSGNGNPVHVNSMDSLLHIMTKSVTTAINGTLLDSLTLPAHCLFDIAGSSTNQAFGVYPGKYKHLEYAFQVDLTGKACTDDITFEIDTYNSGTTGKTASYELAVYGSTTISDANLIGSKIAGFYVTGSGKKYVNLAAALGKLPGDFSNKKVCIYLRTLGTTNASGTSDGLPNATDFVNHVPMVYDPTIVFDNFTFMYGSASWASPVGAIANEVFNHNNGSPVDLGSNNNSDYSGGTPTPVYVGIDTPVTFNLIGLNRIGTLDIKEANNGGGHISKFAFASTGCVKRKVATGGFTQDVTYTYTPSDGTTAMDLLIPAPTSGSINDTLQVSLIATSVTYNMNPSVRLEITNGIRFWYNVGVVGTLFTSTQTINLSKALIWSNENNIFVNNTKEVVIVTSLTGQKIKTATVSQAEKGIIVQPGIYIVKTGDFIQKVLVK